MKDFKPSDWYIGVMDLFTLLIPGALFVFLVQWACFVLNKDAWIQALPPMVSWVLGFSGAYVAGHLLSMTGAMTLDKLYDYRRMKQKLKKPDDFEQKIHRVLCKKYPDFYSSEHIKASRWSRQVVQSKSTEMAAVLEKIEADEKLFRSLCVLSVVSALVTFSFRLYSHENELWWQSLLLFSLAIPTFFRFAYLRERLAKATYRFFVILEHS